MVIITVEMGMEMQNGNAKDDNEALVRACVERGLITVVSLLFFL